MTEKPSLIGTNHYNHAVETAWYIPPAWIPPSHPPPETILDAALLASKAALSAPERQLAYSNIPRLMHQTGQSSKVDTWKPEVIPWVEQWLEYAASPDSASAAMAYFFWDDEGIDMFMNAYEKDFMGDFKSVFMPVERTDIFRILACRYLGGIVRTLFSLLNSHNHTISFQHLEKPFLTTPSPVRRHRHTTPPPPSNLDRPGRSRPLDR